MTRKTIILREQDKTLLPAIMQVLTKIVNNSLQSGRFPEIWKEASVFPLLKKPGLDVIFKEIPSREQLVFCI